MGFTEKILRSGYWWKGIYSFLNEYVENWNGFLIKIDVDATTTFRNDHSVDEPTIGSEYNKDIKPLGAVQGKVNLLMKNMRTNFNDAMDAFASDDGINETTAFTDLKFGSTEYIIDDPNAGVKQLGEHQGDVTDFLDQMQDKFNKCLDVCDGDATLSDTDYFETYGIGDVIATSSSSSSSRSSSSSSSSSSCLSSSSSSSSSSLSSSSSSSLSSSSSSSSCLSSSSSSSSRSLSSSSSSSSSLSLSSSSSSSSSRSSSSSSSSSSRISSSSSSSSLSSSSSSLSSSSSCSSSSSSSSKSTSSSSSSSSSQSVG